MYPVICQIGPFSIFSYGLMLATSFTICSLLAVWRAAQEDVPSETVINFIFIVFISGIIGARIFYVIENIRYYATNPIEIIMFQRGGLSWFGGLILGGICGLAYLKKKLVRVYKFLDLVIPFLALAQAIGRIGCLLNGCCFGRPSGAGIYFPLYRAVLIPTQIYSSLALLVIFIILRKMQDRPHRAGQVFFTYLLLYSLKRFFIEFWRADNAILLWDLSLFQFISIIIFFISLVKLILLKKN